MNEPRFFSYSQINTFRECPRKHFFIYERRWQAEKSAPALAFGAAWGTAMDVVWKHAAGGLQMPNEALVQLAMDSFVETYVNQGMPHPAAMDVDTYQDLMPRVPGTAEEMLRNYIEARKDFLNNVELLGIEEPFIVPIGTHEAQSFYVGKIDKVYRFKRDGKVYALDHKTTSSYAKDGYIRQAFYESFSPNAQMDGYQYALMHQYQGEAAHVIIDAALVHKTVHEGFRLFPVYHANDQLDQWLWEVNNAIDRIYWEERRHQTRPFTGPVMESFPRHTNSCHNFGTSCQFIDVCKVVANPSRTQIPQGFTVNTTPTLARLGISEEQIDELMAAIG